MPWERGWAWPWLWSSGRWSTSLPDLPTLFLLFASFRFLLGISAKDFNWPAASKTVAEWFPSQERSIAVAIFDSGSSVGGALAALMIPWIALAFGWRWSFVFSGVLGFAWLAVWLRVYHPLDRHPRVIPCGKALIHSGPGYLRAPFDTHAAKATLSRPLPGIRVMSAGYCPGACPDRPDMVVLCFLAAAILE